MKTQKLLVAVTVANAALPMCSLSHPHGTATQDVAPVLHGRAWEIVDDNGCVRAEIAVLPAQPKLKVADGTTGYQEAQFGRFNSENSTHVKLLMTEVGGRLVLGGDREQTIKS
jgi:hypothetical protein